ncbi:MAG: EAL domain-containing protein [Eubacterium sp.]|nr:EAL domain-containing protein [Eubacterium sp.]
MIYYDDLPLSGSVMDALRQLKINYVFQSIFDRDGKIYAREALMRPCEMNVVELIELYQKKKMLHVLEVATLFGATQAYFMRGYTEKLSVNSFPSEIFTEEEVQAYIEYFGKDKQAMIIESLEYPEYSEEIAGIKRKFADINANQIALDDFGTGVNDYSAVAGYDPDIIKIDRTLLEGVDQDEEKQNNCRAIIETFHMERRLVVAEGIETVQEYDVMKALGADLFQGYYLEMPQ